ncbi:MAG TPA: phosphatase PAP2 family protein [Methylovirgula sp.]|nr:phosphatase PAP2 family protein [Methylovirgula sp.]
MLLSNMSRSKRQASSHLFLWCGALALTSAFIVLSVNFLDRPISHLGEGLLGRLALVDKFTQTPSFFDPLVLLTLAVFLFRRIIARPFDRLDAACLIAAASLLLTDFTVDKLKYVFGRTWPKYADPSFIRNSVYGFHPFHSGHAYHSFPSGHTAAVYAALSVLWIFYPRFRVLYSVVAIGIAAVLILANYHFLSDVVAGGFLGISCGLLCTLGWNAKPKLM